MDESPAGLYAAKYPADIFGSAQDAGVTALWVSSGADPGYFKTSEELAEYEREPYKRRRGFNKTPPGIV